MHYSYSVVLAVALYIAVLLQLCTFVSAAGSRSSSYQSEHFSSSIVTHHANNDDVALGSFSQQQHHDTHSNKNIQRIEGYGLKLHRSFIDRDPIYYEENNGQHGIATEDESDDIIIHQHTSPQQTLQQHHRWQSPLETISPLPTLSLDSHQSTAGIDIPSSHPIIINTGPQHSHEIDIHQHHEQPKIKLKTRSTGTTITALLAQNSTVLILAADTRATDGSTVADKRCEKLHTLASNVWCAGAGTSADVEALVRRVKFTFWKRGMRNVERYGGVGNMDSISSNGGDWGMHQQDTATNISNEDQNVPRASIPAILHYIRTQLQKTRGNLGVNLLVGGYDYTTQHAHLAAIHPHGSMDVITYAALGSGGLAATGVLESKYPRIGNGKCTIQEGIQLAVDAVRAGIDNDLGSGSQVDVCVIGREGVLYRRAVVREETLDWITLTDDTDDDIMMNGKEEDDIGGSNHYRKAKEGEREEQHHAGVNGFGNVPFIIQSKKIVSNIGIDATKDKKRRWMDEVLDT